jgi:hypothetical protein
MESCGRVSVLCYDFLAMAPMSPAMPNISLPRMKNVANQGFGAIILGFEFCNTKNLRTFAPRFGDIRIRRIRRKVEHN